MADRCIDSRHTSLSPGISYDPLVSSPVLIQLYLSEIINFILLKIHPIISMKCHTLLKILLIISSTTDTKKSILFSVCVLNSHEKSTCSCTDAPTSTLIPLLPQRSPKAPFLFIPISLPHYRITDHIPYLHSRNPCLLPDLSQAYCPLH